MFLEFKYGEMRDLLKHFLTLISGSLVFSVAFSDKIINYESASNTPRGLAIAAWISLVLSLGCCGYGIYTLYLAAEQAIRNVMFSENNDYHRRVRHSYFAQDSAGLLFGLGLVLLVVAASVKSLPPP